MKAEWKDVTSFSRGATDRTPRSWQIDLGKVRVVVTRHIHYGPDVWLMRCDTFKIDKELVSKDIGFAKQEALDIVKGFLVIALEALEN